MGSDADVQRPGHLRCDRGGCLQTGPYQKRVVTMDLFLTHGRQHWLPLLSKNCNPGLHENSRPISLISVGHNFFAMILVVGRKQAPNKASGQHNWVFERAKVVEMWFSCCSIGQGRLIPSARNRLGLPARLCDIILKCTPTDVCVWVRGKCSKQRGQKACVSQECPPLSPFLFSILAMVLAFRHIQHDAWQ